MKHDSTAAFSKGALRVIDGWLGKRARYHKQQHDMMKHTYNTNAILRYLLLFTRPNGELISDQLPALIEP